MKNSRQILTSFTIVALEQAIKAREEGDDAFNEEDSLVIATNAVPFLAEMLKGWSSHLTRALRAASPKEGREVAVPNDEEMLASIGEIVVEALKASNCTPTAKVVIALAVTIITALYRDTAMNALVGVTCFVSTEDAADESEES